MWKLKGPGAFMLPAHAISTKNKHLLAIYSIPARGFTAAVSVFRAHLLRSPSIVKSGLNVLALVSAIDGQTPSVERDRSFLPNLVSRQVTSFRCPLFSTHSFDPFVSLIQSLIDNKKPCSHAVSRVWKFYDSSITCSPPVYPIWVLDSHKPWIV